jgi:protein SCO1/2
MPASELSEPQFAVMVDSLAASETAREGLTALLHEDHAIYDQRGTATIVRMRGWILLALARVGLSDNALLFVLEELDTGHNGYLVAAAARALRSYPSPRAAFAPFVVRALGNMRYQDEAVDLDEYGAYATSVTATTPVRELLATMVWLGPHGREALPQLEAFRTTGRGVSRTLLDELERAVDAVQRAPAQVDSAPLECCTLRIGLGSVSSWPFGTRANSDSVQSIVFEDQDGSSVTYSDFFCGQPSIVAFFYTRCDNPQKCSLTIAKLAEVQRQLAERGADNQVRTAGITYDPGFDLPARLRAYGKNRRLQMNEGHRLLRATDGIEPLRRYFKLGVNFVESLVNRHRIEVYVLDPAGRIAASFERIHWDARQVVDCAVELLNANVPSQPAPARASCRAASPMVATLIAGGAALFPKCPVCWASYLSVFGIAGIEQIPYASWMYPVLLTVMLLNLAGLWWRSRSTERMSGFYLATLGALAIVATKTNLAPGLSPMWGVGLTLAGSVVSAQRGEDNFRPRSRADATAYQPRTAE